MAKNVYMKHHNELNAEELKYIDELKQTCNSKLKLIQDEKEKMKEYESLQRKLETIHKKLSYDIMVPVVEKPDTKTPLCFMEGKIIHTNEVFMPIGTSYYTKITSAEGIDHCTRRIEDLEEEIDELRDERKPLLERLVFMQASRAEGGQVEIIEEYEDCAPEPRSRRDTRGLRVAPKYADIQKNK